MTSMLLMNIKGAFDHVNRKSLQQTMQRIDTDGDLMRCIKSIMLDRCMSPVIYDNLWEERTVETGVLQPSPVSPMFFAIYLSGVFQKVELEGEGCMIMLFTDDCG